MTLFLIRLKTFIKSLVWHIQLGLPKSSQKQIDNRFSICLDCDSYDQHYGQCLECGCNINNRRIFLNKLAWADQKCPLGKWKNLV
jgi:uncharacterized paraquat-inducible protein A